MVAADVQSAGLALRQLRTCVVTCCVIIGLTVAAQMVVWSLVTYTDLRYAIPEGGEDSTFVVTPEELRRRLIRSAGETEEGADDEAASSVPAPGLNQIGVLTNFDNILRDISAMSAAMGTLALVILLPMIMMGIFLVGSSNKPGVDKAISAFVWAVIVAVMALPLGGLMELPWEDGVYRPYETVTREIESVRLDYGGVGAGFMFYARHLVIPTVCLAAMLIIAWRFQSGVDASLPEAAHLIDPELEKEAHQVARQATSLHGGAGRSAGALRRVVGAEPGADASDSEDESSDTDEARQPASLPLTHLTAGEAPRRLI